MQGFRMVLLEVGYGCCGETQVSEQMHGLAIVCSIIFSHLIGVPHPYAAYKFSVFHFCKAILFVKSHQVCIFLKIICGPVVSFNEHSTLHRTV